MGPGLPRWGPNGRATLTFPRGLLSTLLIKKLDFQLRLSLGVALAVAAALRGKSLGHGSRKP